MICEDCVNWKRCARKGAGMLECSSFSPRRRDAGDKRAVVRLLGKDLGEKVYQVDTYSGETMTGSVQVRDTLSGVKRFLREIGIEDVTVGPSLVDEVKAAREERKAREQEEMWGNLRGVPWWEREK